MKIFIEELKKYNGCLKLSLSLRILGIVIETLLYYKSNEYSLFLAFLLSLFGVTLAYLITSMTYAFVFALIKDKGLTYWQKYLKVSLTIFIIIHIVEFIGILVLGIFTQFEMLS